MVGLCIMAGVAVYTNVIGSTMNTALPGSVGSTPPSPALAQISSAPSTQRHEDVATRWIENPQRDPFAPVSIATWQKPSSKPTSTASLRLHVKPHETFDRLELKAIALEARQRSAVINRSVVYEGETIEGYQVVSIELQGVWLQRHGKKRLLTFSNRTHS